MAVGIVVERRDSSHPWQDHTWRPVAVIPGAAAMDPSGPWRELSREDGRALFHAGTLEVELYRTDTDAYREATAGDAPVLFVVLREDADGMHEVTPFAATVSLYEAQDFLDAGEDIVERVPMPEPMAAWVQEFIDAHHTDQSFQKRKRKRHGDGAKAGKPARGRGSGWSEGHEF
jgi:hypothetical protein